MFIYGVKLSTSFLYMIRMCVISVLFIMILACAPANDRQEIRLGTAALGGAYYPLGQGLSSLVTQHLDGVSMVPIVTRGAVENPRLIARGDIELALTNADLAYFAYDGQRPYGEPLNILAAGALHPSVLHLISRADGEISTFEQLEGKRIALGAAGGPTVSLARLLLEAHGMSLDDVVPSFLSYSDGFSQLGDGNIDAAFALAGYPAAGVLQTRATQDLSFIQIDSEIMAQFIIENPYYYLVDMPKEVYDTNMGSTLLAVPNILIVSGNADADFVFDIVGSIYGNLQQLQQTNAIAQKIDLSQIEHLPIPLHPGASQYFMQQ
ncbi:MAG: TRAP transporter substrate-binding protein [Gammaproteobacteria bacterium]|nr:TRAP transporter substrate-binding protein [Gammaproteobacteria bacterium]